MSSDPGIRFLEENRTAEDEEDEEDAAGAESLATENSDEEPLEGEPLEHVEALLARCLAPDERTRPGDEQDDGEEEEDYASEEDELNELDQRLSDGEKDGSDAAEDSDAEDIEEAAALRLHLYTLKQGIQDFDAWAKMCIAEVEDAGSPGSSADAAAATDPQLIRGPIGKVARRRPAAAEAARELHVQLAELRDLHANVKLLLLNQQALCAHYTQHLLRVAHAQADLAMRHHKESQRRHKQLRIVRRESARLCRSLEDRAATAMASASSSSDGSGVGGGGGGGGLSFQKGGPPPPPPKLQSLPPPPASRREKGGRNNNTGGGAATDANAGVAAAAASLGGSGVPRAEFVRLVHRAVGRAARQLESKGAGGDKLRQPSSRSKKGLSDAATAYAAVPQKKSSSPRERDRSPKAKLNGGESDAHARLLRTPAVQAAIADALWAVVAEEAEAAG